MLSAIDLRATTYHGCECVCDEMKVKNPEKKFWMAVDVRFLMLWFSIPHRLQLVHMGVATEPEERLSKHHVS